MGIGTTITRLGFGGALLSGALAYMLKPEGTGGYNPIDALKDYLGEDSIISKLFTSGAGVGAAGFLGALAMPKAFGGVRSAAMSIAGLYTAYGAAKGMLSGHYNGLPGQIADLGQNLGVDLSGLGTSNAPAPSAVLDADSLKSLTQIAARPMQDGALANPIATQAIAGAEEAAAHVHKASADATTTLLADLKRPLTRDEMNAAINNMDAFGADVQDIDGVFEHDAEENVPTPEIFATLENDEVA